MGQSTDWKLAVGTPLSQKGIQTDLQIREPSTEVGKIIHCVIVHHVKGQQLTDATQIDSDQTEKVTHRSTLGTFSNWKVR